MNTLVTILLESIPAIVIMVVMLSIPGVLLLRLVYLFFEWLVLYFMPLRETQRAVLEKEFPYYVMLGSADKRRRFERKVIFFLHKKKFIGKKKLKITKHMSLLIGASAAQLTFGLRDLRFSYFGTITIFPRAYFNKLTQRMHQGEVNMRIGSIVLSWEDVKKGLDDPQDGRNVLLHELAHAMRIEDAISNDEYRFLEDNYLERFDRFADQMIRSREVSPAHGFIRKYGFSNKEEFFAVAIELFFERPRAFRKRIPELYRVLTRILNQDPAAMMDEFISLQKKAN